ncbi:SRPBCC family protein [Thermocoleostomius sinensis]|uniref:SRPBCC family protein n=1 Tax=Thermocoleostomius sinensis A174 TaxID=2016057 RepID=A0A9E8ZF77_9CYAN|nr:SRPBCC family protein [Thermocoleostomius sinensis]WAL61716.1 SRPBCC family protein [Thermocoleostomius sinensis A174]
MGWSNSMPGMRLRKSIYLGMSSLAVMVWLTVAPISSAVGGDRIIHQPTEQLLALQPGEVSVSGESGQYVGQVLATGSVEAAWAALTDYNNFASFFPDVETSRLLESNGNQKVFEQVNVVRVFPFTRRTRVVISATESYPQQISFNVIEGDVESLQGVWQLESVGSNQVLVTHRVSIDPGSSPTRDLFFNIYKNSLDDTMAALGQEITRRSGG